jgi:hypothetical protein
MIIEKNIFINNVSENLNISCSFVIANNLISESHEYNLKIVKGSFKID